MQNILLLKKRHWSSSWSLCKELTYWSHRFCNSLSVYFRPILLSSLDQCDGLDLEVVLGYPILAAENYVAHCVYVTLLLPLILSNLFVHKCTKSMAT